MWHKAAHYLAHGISRHSSSRAEIRTSCKWIVQLLHVRIVFLRTPNPHPAVATIVLPVPHVTPNTRAPMMK